MENPLRKQIRSIMKDHKKRQMWYRIVTTLAVVVVFVTTYMLILPAITMENKAECGITEHKHDANCYSSHYEKEKELACTTDSLGVHKHTEACYDKDGNLVCTIPEHKLHQHTPECYQMQKQLVCTQEESRRNLSRGFSAKVTNYSIDVFDNLFLRVSLRQFYIKFYAFSLSKTVEKRSSVDYTKRLSNTSNKFFSANCLTTSCIVSSTKFAYSSFDIVINLFMDLSRSGK